MNEDGLHDVYVDALNSVLEDTLDTLAPRQMLQYLAKHGWTYLREAPDGSGQEWSLLRGGIVRDWVMVPVDEEDAMYRVLMRACLRGVLASEPERLREPLANIIPLDLR